VRFTQSKNSNTTQPTYSDALKKSKTNNQNPSNTIDLVKQKNHLTKNKSKNKGKNQNNKDSQICLNTLEYQDEQIVINQNNLGNPNPWNGNELINLKAKTMLNKSIIKGKIQPKNEGTEIKINSTIYQDYKIPSIGGNILEKTIQMNACSKCHKLTRFRTCLKCAGTDLTDTNNYLVLSDCSEFELCLNSQISLAGASAINVNRVEQRLSKGKKVNKKQNFSEPLVTSVDKFSLVDKVCWFGDNLELNEAKEVSKIVNNTTL